MTRYLITLTLKADAIIGDASCFGACPADVLVTLEKVEQVLGLVMQAL